MNFEFTPLCYVRFLSGMIALVLIGFLWKRRNSQGAVYLMLFELTAAIWAISDGFEAAATTVSMKLPFAQISYIGISTSAVMFLVFALSYTNHLQRFNWKMLSLVFVIPAFTIIMAFTNEFHHLLWTQTVISEGTNNSIYYYGPYFWINVIYEYSALTAGIVFLLIAAFKAYSIYKAHFWILIISTFLPFASSIVYVFKLLPVKGIDPTPISFIITGLLVAISLYRLGMFNIMPIARRQAIDNLRDGMIVINSENRIVDANPAFCNMIGLPVNKVIRSKTDIVFAKMKIEQDQFREENDFTLEVQITENDDTKYFEVKCHNISDNNKQHIGKIFLFLDITTKKLILDTIADSNNRRRSELIEKEKLIRDLDAYARSVAHDLKNPLASIVSLSELIKNSLLVNKTDEALEMTEMVHDQSMRMTVLIDDLLLLSRIRKEDVKIESVDMKKILAGVLPRFQEETNLQKAIFEMPDKWPEVLGHNMWLEQVWMNLISNALKYGGKPPVIKLGFEKVSETQYRFSIHDNGNGLSAESLSKIFSDFERLGRKDITGHGLGLSIVRRIIEKLGGEVSVKSSNQKGEGCIFSFTLKAFYVFQEEKQVTTGL
jgi:PAS domain S-box-containing protein